MSNPRNTYVVRHPVTGEVIATRETTRTPTHAVAIIMHRIFGPDSDPSVQMTASFKFGVICLSGSEDLAHKQARAHARTEYVILPVALESEIVEVATCEIWYTGGKKRRVICTLQKTTPDAEAPHSVEPAPAFEVGLSPRFIGKSPAGVEYVCYPRYNDTEETFEARANEMQHRLYELHEKHSELSALEKEYKESCRNFAAMIEEANAEREASVKAESQVTDSADSVAYSINNMTFNLACAKDIDDALADVDSAILAILTNTNLYHQDRLRLDDLSEARDMLLAAYSDFNEEDPMNNTHANDIEGFIDMEEVIRQQEELDEMIRERAKEEKLSHTIHTKAVVVVDGRVFTRSTPYGDEVVYTEERPWPQRYEIVFGSRFRDLSERGKIESHVGVRHSNLDGQNTDCPIQLFNNENIQWIEGPFTDIESAIKAGLSK